MKLKLVMYIDPLEPTFFSFVKKEYMKIPLGGTVTSLYTPPKVKTPKNKIVDALLIDYLNHIKERTGLTWNVSYNCLFIGPPKHLFIQPFAKKYFQYGETGETRLFTQLSHISSDYAEPYSSVEIDDAANVSASVGGAVNNPDKKTETSTVLVSKETIKVYAEESVVNVVGQERMRQINYETQLKNQALDTKKQVIESLDAKVKNMIPRLLDPTAADSPEHANLLQTARNWSDSAKEFSIKINGAIGDPFFSAGNIFWFTGLLRHTGPYTARVVEHYYDNGGYYIMNIQGVKGYDPVVKTVAQKKLEGLDAKEKAKAYSLQKFLAYSKESVVEVNLAYSDPRIQKLLLAEKAKTGVAK